MVPQANAAEEAGNLTKELPKLWAGVNLELEGRRELLITMLGAVCFETKEARSGVAIRPKPPFRPIFKVAVNRTGSGVCIINEPSNLLSEGSAVFLVETGEN